MRATQLAVGKTAVKGLDLAALSHRRFFTICHFRPWLLLFSHLGAALHLGAVLLPNFVTRLCLRIARLLALSSVSDQRSFRHSARNRPAKPRYCNPVRQGAYEEQSPIIEDKLHSKDPESVCGS